MKETDEEFPTMFDFLRPSREGDLYQLNLQNSTKWICRWQSTISLSENKVEAAKVETPVIRSRTKDGIPIRMLVLGAPGAGKGTQSTRIRRNFDIATISSGDVLRRNISEGTASGVRARDAVARGELVSDDIIVNLIRSELESIPTNWLLDGFPRNIAQAMALDKMLASTGQELNSVVNLDVPEDVILERIVQRYIHVPSGRVYNLTYNPPKVLGVDDITGEPLEHRPDDNPESFRRRLLQYRSLTKPLLDYYNSRGILVSFSGSTSDAIFPQIMAYLNKRFE